MCYHTQPIELQPILVLNSTSILHKKLKVSRVLLKFVILLSPLFEIVSGHDINYKYTCNNLFKTAWLFYYSHKVI